MPYLVDLKSEDERVSEFVRLFERCVQGRAETEQRWFANEKLYSGYIDPQTWPYNAMISVRKVWEFVETEHALLYQGTTAPNPAFVAMPVSIDDVQSAYKVREYMLWQWETGMDFYSQWDRLILTGLIYGYAPAAVDWRVIMGYVPTRIPFNTRASVTKAEQRITYQGPRLTWQDPYSVYVDPSCIEPKRSPYFFRRLIVHWDELDSLAKRGRVDRKVVDEIKGANSQIVTTDYRDRINKLLNRHTGTQWSDYDLNKDVEVIEGYFPFENYYMLITGNKRLLTEGPIVYYNAEHPFVFWTNFTCLWDWRGWSSPELAEDQQHETNFLRNARLDNVNMALNPMFVKGRGAGYFDNQLTFRPWGFIEVDDINQMKPLEFRDTWSQSTLQEEAMLDKDIESALGLTDQRRGIQPAPRETRYNQMVRNEASGVRLGHKFQGLFNFMKDILNRQNHLNRQYIDTTQTVRRVLGKDIPGYVIDGGRAAQGLNSQEMNAPIEIEVKPEDIMKDYDFVLMPTGSYGNRHVRKDELVQLVQLFQSAPNLGAVTNWPAMARMIFQEWDLRNVDELVVNTQAAQAMAQQMGQGAGGVPQNANGGVVGQGGAPQPLNPMAAMAAKGGMA